jgi:signal transduction histidine kinase
MVQQAMRRRKYVLSEETDNVQLKVLFALLGSSEVGPLLVQPLVAGEQVIGAVIVGNSRSRRPFTPNEAKLCESMAEQLVTAIQNVRRYQQARTRVDELNRAVAAERRAVGLVKARLSELAAQLSQKVTEVDELSQREEAAREARNALEIKLVTSRAEADALSKRLSVLETDLAQAHANAEAQVRWHEEELERLETEWFQTDDTTHWIHTVLQGMTVGVIIANGAGAIQEANVAAEILLDQESEQIQQEDLLALVEDERWKQAIKAARRGEAVRLTLQVGPNILMCDVTPLPGLEAELEEVKALVVVLQDISAEASEQREQLEMISTMAEELRTPMTTIVNYVDLLLSGAVGDLAESQRKYLLRVKASVERMGQMTDDLAREASGEKRWNSPQRQSMDLRRFLERTVSGNSLLLEDKDLSLNLSLPESLPSVRADPDYLRRVMANLLSNACRASGPGGQIQVEAIQSNGLLDQQGPLDAADDGFVIVSIRDSGGGLSDDALNRVFDRRRPSGTPRGLGESGAGLALVKALVEAHGGRLWIESEAGVGTTFSFVLPVNEWDRTAEASELSRAVEGNGAT